MGVPLVPRAAGNPGPVFLAFQTGAVLVKHVDVRYLAFAGRGR